MTTYPTIKVYLESSTSLQDKITKYDQIISALESAALAGAEQQDIEEYSLDDGQTKIKRILRDPNLIFKAIENYMKLREIALNKLNGRVVRLVDYNSNKKY